MTKGFYDVLYCLSFIILINVPYNKNIIKLLKNDDYINTSYFILKFRKSQCF